MRKREFVKALTDPVLVVNQERGKESIGICLGRDIENRGSEINGKKKKYKKFKGEHSKTT